MLSDADAELKRKQEEKTQRHIQFLKRRNERLMGVARSHGVRKTSYACPRTILTTERRRLALASGPGHAVGAPHEEVTAVVVERFPVTIPEAETPPVPATAQASRRRTWSSVRF